MSSITKARATHKLEDLVVTKVSLVDKAAVEEDYLIIKCAERDQAHKENAMSDKPTVATLPESLKAVQAVIEKAELSDEQRTALVSILADHKETEVEGSEIEKASVSVEALTALITAAATPAPTPEPEAPKEESTEDVLKSLGDDRKRELLTKALEDERTAVEKAEAKAEKLEKDVAILKADVRARTFVEKSEGFENVGQSAELASVLNSVDANCSPEVVAQLDTIFKAVNEQLEGTDLFKSVGSAGAGASASPLGNIEALAQARKAKDDITIEKAYDLVIQENPKLYAQAQGGN